MTDQSTEDTQWLTTAQNPRAPQYGADQGQRGWRIHAVKATKSETLSACAARSAACGLLPAHGWDMDLFVDRPCARCLVATGLACSVCRGRGSTGKVADGTHQTCNGCNGGYTAKAQRALAALGEQLAQERARRAS